MTATIRGYRPADRDRIGTTCNLTAYTGNDPSKVVTDPELLPSMFAYPYLALEPELAFVCSDGDTAVGYIVGTSDTPTFVERYRREWLPTLASRYPVPEREPANRAERAVHRLYHPEYMLSPALVAYPAHLHIGLLPPYQGRGYGRQLMTRFLAALSDAGVARVHLGMDRANRQALRFYRRSGFHLIVAYPDALLLGRATGT